MLQHPNWDECLQGENYLWRSAVLAHLSSDLYSPDVLGWTPEGFRALLTSGKRPGSLIQAGWSCRLLWGPKRFKVGLPLLSKQDRCTSHKNFAWTEEGNKYSIVYWLIPPSRKCYSPVPQLILTYFADPSTLSSGEDEMTFKTISPRHLFTLLRLALAILLYRYPPPAALNSAIHLHCR